MAKWLPLKEDFDKTLPIKKWRCDVNVKLSVSNYDGALSELPNIDIKTCWSNSRPENGYAFENRFNAGSSKEYFSNRYYGFRDGKWTATTTSHTTKVEGTSNTYEFECPVDLYWAGNKTDPWDPLLETKFQLYVEASSLEVDVEDITATSGSNSFTINVSADTGVSWTASSEDTWINLSPTTGMGNGAITVNIPANPTYEERSGEIALLSSDEGDITIPVYQAKKAAILTRHQMYRNGEVINKAYRGGELVYLNIISPEPVYSAMPLTFEIISGGTISWYNHYGNAYTNKTIYYSKDNGITWSGITSSSSTGSVPSISVSAGESILFKGNSETYGQILSDRHYYTFSGSTAYFNLKGNIMSMIYGDDYLNNTVLTNKSNFYGMFYSTNVVDCTNLILPTMSLTNSCYSRMFNNCASLTGAPKLPATTLADSCYGYMFTNCTSLTTAPELKQEVLTDNCYNGMFWGCTNLNYIKCLATDISASDCVNTWTYLVQTTSGTFVKAASMSGWTRDSNGIPVNWTVENA